MKQQIELAELRGFFFADGTVSLHKRRLRNKYVRKDGTKRKEEWNYTFVVRIHIAQRIDNLPLLKEFTYSVRLKKKFTKANPPPIGQSNQFKDVLIC